MPARGRPAGAPRAEQRDGDAHHRVDARREVEREPHEEDEQEREQRPALARTSGPPGCRPRRRSAVATPPGGGAVSKPPIGSATLSPPAAPSRSCGPRSRGGRGGDRISGDGEHNEKGGRDLGSPLAVKTKEEGTVVGVRKGFAATLCVQ